MAAGPRRRSSSEPLDSGQWLSDSDFVWREQRVVAEFDGDHHRTNRQQWQNDVARRENLQDDGWAFIQLTYASVMVYPRNQATIRRLRGLRGLLGLVGSGSRAHLPVKVGPTSREVP